MFLLLLALTTLLVGALAAIAISAARPKASTSPAELDALAAKIIEQRRSSDRPSAPRASQQSPAESHEASLQR